MPSLRNNVEDNLEESDMMEKYEHYESFDESGEEEEESILFIKKNKYVPLVNIPKGEVVKKSITVNICSYLQQERENENKKKKKMDEKNKKLNKERSIINNSINSRFEEAIKKIEKSKQDKLNTKQ